MSTATTSVLSAPVALSFPAFPEYDPPVVDWNGREREPVDAPAWLASLSGLCSFVTNTDDASERAARAVCYALSADWDGKKSATDIADTLTSEPATSYSDFLSRMAIRSARYSAYQRAQMTAQGTLLADYVAALFEYATGHAIRPVPCDAEAPPTAVEVDDARKMFREGIRRTKNANVDNARKAGRFMALYLRLPGKLRSEGVDDLLDSIKRYDTGKDATLRQQVELFLRADGTMRVLGDGSGIAPSNDIPADKQTRKHDEPLDWGVICALCPLVDRLDEGNKNSRRNEYVLNRRFVDLSFPVTETITHDDDGTITVERKIVPGPDGAPMVLTYAQHCQRIVRICAESCLTERAAGLLVREFIDECEDERVKADDAAADKAQEALDTAQAHLDALLASGLSLDNADVKNAADCVEKATTGLERAEDKFIKSRDNRDKRLAARNPKPKKKPADPKPADPKPADKPADPKAPEQSRLPDLSAIVANMADKDAVAMLSESILTAKKGADILHGIVGAFRAALPDDEDDSDIALACTAFLTIMKGDYRGAFLVEMMEDAASLDAQVIRDKTELSRKRRSTK